MDLSIYCTGSPKLGMKPASNLLMLKLFLLKSSGHDIYFFFSQNFDHVVNEVFSPFGT